MSISLHKLGDDHNDDDDYNNYKKNPSVNTGAKNIAYKFAAG